MREMLEEERNIVRGMAADFLLLFSLWKWRKKGIFEEVLNPKVFVLKLGKKFRSKRQANSVLVVEAIMGHF